MRLEVVNILFLAFVFIWQAIQLNLLGGFDGAGRINSGVAIIVISLNLIVNSEYRNVIFNNTSVKIWILWLIYAIINTLFLYDENIEDVSTMVFILNRLFVPFSIMSIVASFTSSSTNQLLKYLMYVLFLVAVIFLAGSSLIEGRYVNELLNINELILLVIALVATIIIKSIRDEVRMVKVLILLIFPTYFILMAGSRMGFGAYLILVFGYLLVKRNTNFYFFLIQLAIITVLSISLFHLVMENTLLGERLLSTTEQSEQLLNTTSNNTLLKFLGDRGGYYINGWDLFKQNPIFGIGLLNYIKTNNYVCHVEYIIHLAELGAIGFLLYILFIRSMFSSVRRKLRMSIKRVNEEYVYFILFCILFCGLVLFLYNSYAVAYLFGLIILFVKEETEFVI